MANPPNPEDDFASRLGRMAEDLRAEEARLKERLKDLDRERGTVQAQLKRVRGLLAAVEPKAAAGQKAGYTKGELKTLAAGMLRDGPLDEAALKQKLLERAGADGRSGKGLPVLLRQVLAQAPFTKAEGGYTVSER